MGPSSAKLVIAKIWHDGIHCHDYKPSAEIIEISTERSDSDSHRG